MPRFRSRYEEHSEHSHAGMFGMLLTESNAKHVLVLPNNLAEIAIRLVRWARAFCRVVKRQSHALNEEGPLYGEMVRSAFRVHRKNRRVSLNRHWSTFERNSGSPRHWVVAFHEPSKKWCRIQQVDHVNGVQGTGFARMCMVEKMELHLTGLSTGQRVRTSQDCISSMQSPTAGQSEHSSAFFSNQGWNWSFV